MRASTLQRSRWVRTAGSAGWMGIGRLLGLGFRVVLIAQLGAAPFGTFAMVLAAAGLVSGPLDQYYLVRAPRVTDDEFTADRSARWCTGVAMTVAAIGVAQLHVLLGLVVAKAGIDIAFNAGRSDSIREGDPAGPYRWEAARQAIGVALGLAVLFGADGGVVEVAVAYLLGLAFVAALPAARILRHRPRAPRMERSTAAVTVEALAGAVYLQADVLLVGLLASPAQAGYYALGSLAVATIALVAQNFSVTFHASLRATDGDVRSGPPLRTIVLLAGVAGIGMVVVSLALLVFGADHVLWTTFAILAVAAALRVTNAIYATLLVVQGRDTLRMRMSLVATATKIGGVLLLAPTLGAPGAALAFALGEVVLLRQGHRALHGDRS